MGWFRAHRRCPAWIGVLALLCSAVLATLTITHTKANAVVDDVLGHLVICGVSGSDTAPGGGQQDGSPAHCPACMLLKGFVLAAVILVLAAIVVPPREGARLVLVRLRLLADHLSLGGIRSRAPPLFA